MTCTLVAAVPGGSVTHVARLIVADYADGRRETLVPWWPRWAERQGVVPSLS